MKKIKLVLLCGLTTFFMMGCHQEASDDSKKVVPNQTPSTEKVTITYTSNAPDGFSGFAYAKVSVNPINGPYYPTKVPASKQVEKTASDDGYDGGYTITADDLPEYSEEKLLFVGWYNDANQKVKVGDVIFADTTLNAVWEDGLVTGAIVYKPTTKSEYAKSDYTYAGNYSANFGTPIGILVSYIPSNGDVEKYVVMNFTESDAELAWTTAELGLDYELQNLQSFTGADVTEVIKGREQPDTYPAFSYCYNLASNGMKWFLPSEDEFFGINFSNIELVNHSLEVLSNNSVTATKLSEKSATERDGDTGDPVDLYWTSTQYNTDGSLAKCWELTASPASSIDVPSKKTSARKVRAFALLDDGFGK